MLKNKTILITGSSRGIGAATAILAKKYGADVILHGKTDSLKLRNLSKKIHAPYFFCNIADEKIVEKELKKFKKIDILVKQSQPSREILRLKSGAK